MAASQTTVSSSIEHFSAMTAGTRISGGRDEDFDSQSLNRSPPTPTSISDSAFASATTDVTLRKSDDRHTTTPLPTIKQSPTIRGAPLKRAPFASEGVGPLKTQTPSTLVAVTLVFSLPSSAHPATMTRTSSAINFIVPSIRYDFCAEDEEIGYRRPRILPILPVEALAVVNSIGRVVPEPWTTAVSVY